MGCDGHFDFGKERTRCAVALGGLKKRKKIDKEKKTHHTRRLNKQTRKKQKHLLTDEQIFAKEYVDRYRDDEYASPFKKKCMTK